MTEFPSNFNIPSISPFFLKKQGFEYYPRVRAESVRYLSFEGGGGRGLAYLGAIDVLERKNISLKNQIQGIAGSSAGAITAFLLYLGLNSREIEAKSPAFKKFFEKPSPGVYKAVKWQNGRNQVGYAIDNIEKVKFKDEIYFDKKYKIKEKRVQVSDFEAEELNAKQEGRKQFRKFGLRFLNIIPGYRTLKEILFNMIIKKMDDPATDLNPLEVLKSQKDEVIYSFLFDRGLFAGFEVRKFFSTIIAETVGISVEEAKTITFKRLQQKLVDKYGATYQNKKLAVFGTNLNQGRAVEFSITSSPDFPVVEAVSISMSFPLAFKPTYCDAIGDQSRSKVYNRRFKGLFSDGGQLINIPIHAFNYEDQPELKCEKVVDINKQILGFGLSSGPEMVLNYQGDKRLRNPNYYRDPDYRKFLASFDKKERKKWVKEQLEKREAFKKQGQENDYLFEEERSGILMAQAGRIINTFMGESERGQFRVGPERAHYLELFTYDLDTFNFAPKEDLFRFIRKMVRKQVSEYFQFPYEQVRIDDFCQ